MHAVGSRKRFGHMIFAVILALIVVVAVLVVPDLSASERRSPDLFARPLAAGSAILPSSPEFVSNFVADYKRSYGSVGVNMDPVMVVPGRQPLVPVSVRQGCNDFRADTGSRIPIPPRTPLTGSGDNPVIVVQPSRHLEWELWQASRTEGSWSACWGGRLDTATSDGVFPFPYGLSASGISYLSTEVTERDVESGSIKHAIAVQLPACTAPAVSPANRTDCGNDPGQPPYGTYFRFPATLKMPSGLTPFARMAFSAIKHYGMVVTDQAGAVMIQAESPADWAVEGRRGTDPITASWGGRPEYAVIAALPWDRLEAVSGP